MNGTLIHHILGVRTFGDVSCPLFGSCGVWVRSAVEISAVRAFLMNGTLIHHILVVRTSRPLICDASAMSVFNSHPPNIRTKKQNSFVF